MKRIKLFTILCLGLTCIQSCSDNIGDANKKKTGGSFELGGRSNNDTINLIDGEDNKQGHWIKKGFAVVSHTINTAVPPDTIKHTKVSFGTEQIIVEEGNYLDNKKTGYWKNYLPNGNLKDSVYYK